MGLLLIFFTICLIAFVLGIGFLLKRISMLEARARELSQSQSQGIQHNIQDPVFDTNDGEQLWLLLSTPNESSAFDAKTLEDARQRYAFIMIKHAASVFEAGKRDAARGEQNTPANAKRITTLRGAIQSWMPMEHASALYECGRHAQMASSEEERAPARVTIDQVCRAISNQLHLAVDLQLADRLLPVALTPAANSSAATA